MMDIFHEGERAVQRLAGETAMAERNAPIIAGRIMAGARPFLEKQSMAVVAYADRARLVWASLLFGRPGFMRSDDGSAVEIDIGKVIRQPHDPLWASIGSGMQVGMLAIELASRRRIRINGDLVPLDDSCLRLSVRESYPNCPKYITRRSVRIAPADSVGVQRFAEGLQLGAEGIVTAQATDVFFIGTVHPERGLDASHRGGAPGFVEVLDAQTLRIADYPGNSMFNTLGNLAIDARAGILIPDFRRRVVLRLTGHAETLWNQPDDRGLSGGTQRFLQFHIERWNEEPMPAGVDAEFFDYSPFNP